MKSEKLETFKHTTMYDNINCQIARITEASLDHDTVSNMYCIKPHKDGPVIFAEILAHGLVYLEDGSGEHSDMLDMHSMNLSRAQQIVRDMCDEAATS